MNEESSGSSFPRTRWTLVTRLQESKPEEGLRAWDDLCRAYQKPVLDYIVRHHRWREEVEDLAQEFFCKMVQQNLLRDVDAAKGRLRAWMLMLLKRFLCDARTYAQAQKRGGHLERVSLEEYDAPTGGAEEVEERDAVFDRQWAFALIERVFTRLREESRRPAQQRILEALRPLLLHTPPGALKEVALQQGMEEGTVKVALHRLRHRFGNLLREEVALTVASDEEVDEELRYLLKTASAG